MLSRKPRKNNKNFSKKTRLELVLSSTIGILLCSKEGKRAFLIRGAAVKLQREKKS